MGHKTTVEELEGWPKTYVARCSCRFIGKQTQHKWEAEDEQRQHDEKVQRVLALLRPRNHTASLVRSERDYYLERAADPDESEANRRLWQQLADELTPRIASKTVDQDGLW